MFTDKFPEIKRDLEVPLHFRANRASAGIQHVMNLLNAASARRLHQLERHYLQAIADMTQDNLDWLENSSPLEWVSKKDIDLKPEKCAGDWDPNNGIIVLWDLSARGSVEHEDYFHISNSDGGQFNKGDYIIWDSNNTSWVIIK